jgi:hypothetical protein
MSEHITHIAVYEYCSGLARYSNKVNPLLKESLQQYADMGLMASASRGNHLYAVPILTRAKETGHTDNKMKMQIAAALGWMTHRASDLQMKPIFKYIDEDDPYFSQSENQIYHDAVTFREVYGGGTVPSISDRVYFSPATLEPGMKSMPAASAVNVALAESLFAHQVQRSLMAQRAFVTKEKDMQTWLQKFLEERQYYSEDLRVYFDAFQNPDEKKMKKYIADVNYFDEDDGIIRLAKALHRGEQPPAIPLPEAIEKAATQSQFAQALRRGMIYMEAGSDYYEGKMEKQAMYDVFEVFDEEHRI